VEERVELMRLAFLISLLLMTSSLLFILAWRSLATKVHIIFVNYATASHKSLQNMNSEWARAWGAHEVRSFSPELLDTDFIDRNRTTITQQRGGGYWIWKPHIIRKTMEDDQKRGSSVKFVVYCDSSSCVDFSTYDLSMMMTGKDIAAFELHQTEKLWVKGDLVAELSPGNNDLESPQLAATFICFRDSDFSRSFLKQWERLVQVPQLVTDVPSIAENSSDFKEHRHDQAIFSLLCKKYPERVYKIPLHKLRHHQFG
jgi:hypothetical protein